MLQNVSIFNSPRTLQEYMEKISDQRERNVNVDHIKKNVMIEHSVNLFVHMSSTLMLRLKLREKQRTLTV